MISDFPFYSQGKDVPIYLDSAATTLKPVSVLSAMYDYDANYTANIHRSSVQNQATLEYENTRDKVKSFINANHREEIIFTPNCTHSINMVANSIYAKRANKIIVTEVEHHSNIVPWLQTGRSKHAGLEVINVVDNSFYQNLEATCAKYPSSLVAIPHIPNSFSVVFDIKVVTKIAHKHDCLVMVDGSQAVGFMQVDVKYSDVDFYVFSAHKMFGPTGVGVLYAKQELLEHISPLVVGGGMVGSTVNWSRFDMGELPFRLEAGTPNISGVIGLGAAIDWITSQGIDKINAHDREMIAQAYQQFYKKLRGVSVLASSHHYDHVPSSNILCFTVKDVAHEDLAYWFDSHNIIVRTGGLCARPGLERYNSGGIVRISVGPYTRKHDINTFIEVFSEGIEQFRG